MRGFACAVTSAGTCVILMSMPRIVLSVLLVSLLLAAAGGRGDGRDITGGARRPTSSPAARAPT